MRDRKNHQERQRRVTLGLRPETYQALHEAAEADDRSLSYTADQIIHEALVRSDGGADGGAP